MVDSPYKQNRGHYSIGTSEYYTIENKRNRLVKIKVSSRGESPAFLLVSKRGSYPDSQGAWTV